MIKRALDDDDARVRRGATRIFAYQFHGMDERQEFAERLIELCADPDLWTRLQALKTLAPVVLSNSRPGAVAADRRDLPGEDGRVPKAAVVRKNLSEGLYIMLDENLGGGVSLQKNVEQLPVGMRPRILEARRAFERDVLFAPLVAALGGETSCRSRPCSRALTARFSREGSLPASPRR